MKLSNVRRYEWISAAFGAALLACMFLDWYRAGGDGANAWQAFSVIDVVIALAALLGMSLAFAAASQRAPALAQALAAFATIAAGIATVLVAFRVASTPAPYDSRETGLWLGLALSIGLTLAAWRSVADERFPDSLRSQVEVPLLPAPAPDGSPRTGA